MILRELLKRKSFPSDFQSRDIHRHAARAPSAVFGYLRLISCYSLVSAAAAVAATSPVSSTIGRVHVNTLCGRRARVAIAVLARSSVFIRQEAESKPETLYSRRSVRCQVGS